MKLGIPFSAIALFWILVGMLRQFHEQKLSKRKYVNREIIAKKLKKVAICISAYNEEEVIERTINSVKKLVPTRQVYVVSNGSTDRTAKIAKRKRCNLLELSPGKGKAKALVTLIKHYGLLREYEFILFVDADTLINPQYVNRALRVFEIYPDTVAIAGYVITRWRKHWKLTKQKFITAYRVRLNQLLQLFLVYGQTWRFANAATVIPGSASMYRTTVLKKLRLDTPGILIEDFSLAFQIHKKKLGKIAHFPEIYSFDQEPSNLKDYWNQVRRWNIGYYQTVRKHGIWASPFWLSTGLFTFEVIVNALFVASLPLFLLLLSAQYFTPFINPQIVAVSQFASRNFLTFWEAVFLVFVTDYSLTLFTALREKKFILAIYGLGFLFFRYLDSLILITSIPKGIFSRSTGWWAPPKRS